MQEGGGEETVRQILTNLKGWDRRDEKVKGERGREKERDQKQGREETLAKAIRGTL